MGGSCGAATSLVQQPQEEERTAVALTAMASSRRIMVDLFYLRMVVGKEFSILGIKKTPPISMTERAGLKTDLLGWCLISWCWSWCAWAAGCGEERCDGGDDCKFDHVHDVVLCLVVVGSRSCLNRLLLGRLTTWAWAARQKERPGQSPTFRLSGAVRQTKRPCRRPIRPAIRRSGFRRPAFRGHRHLRRLA